jgi:hypothetical protein
MTYKPIYIQSAPRSANTYLLYNLKKIDYSLDVSKSTDINAFATPTLDNVCVSVMRNPADSIFSNTAMTLNGRSETLSGGNLNNLIIKQIQEYQKFCDYIDTNIDYIFPFTFDQIQNNAKDVIDFVLKSANYEQKYTFYDIQPKDKIVPVIYENAVINKKFLATSKSIELYSILKNNVKDLSVFDLINEIYEDVLTRVKDRQQQLNINF